MFILLREKCGCLLTVYELHLRILILSLRHPLTPACVASASSGSQLTTSYAFLNTAVLPPVGITFQVSLPFVYRELRVTRHHEDMAGTSDTL
jgi:hypothetical protein